jgi:hypothetical protein
MFHQKGRLNAMHRLQIGLVVPIGLLAAGCGSKGDVSGKVLYNGKPLTGGVVTFIPASGKGAYNSNIKEDGSYSMTKVPTGKAKITVKSVAPGGTLSPMEKRIAEGMKGFKKDQLSPEAIEKMPGHDKAGSGSGKFVAIPAHYSDPDKSGVEYEVTSGKQDHNIELK